MIHKEVSKENLTRYHNCPLCTQTLKQNLEVCFSCPGFGQQLWNSEFHQVNTGVTSNVDMFLRLKHSEKRFIPIWMNNVSAKYVVKQSKAFLHNALNGLGTSVAMAPHYWHYCSVQRPRPWLSRVFYSWNWNGTMQPFQKSVLSVVFNPSSTYFTPDTHKHTYANIFCALSYFLHPKLLNFSHTD